MHIHFKMLYINILVRGITLPLPSHYHTCTSLHTCTYTKATCRPTTHVQAPEHRHEQIIQSTSGLLATSPAHKKSPAGIKQFSLIGGYPSFQKPPLLSPLGRPSPSRCLGRPKLQSLREEKYTEIA